MSPEKWIEAADATNENLIPPELTPAQVAYTYANEVDMFECCIGWKDREAVER